METRPMNICMSYCSGDRDQAIRSLSWIKEIGALREHKLFTMCAFDCQPIEDILPSTKIQDSAKITGGEWNKDISARSASAPNEAYRIFCWYFYVQKLGPFLFLEPDAVVLKPSTFDDLEAEYAVALSQGKWFLGTKVEIDNIPVHLSGVSVYPQDTPALAPTVIQRSYWMPDSAKPNETFELAFDIAGAKEILPQAFFTKLIQHNFRHPGFKSRAEMEAFISPDAVLYHANKDGSAYPFLREIRANKPQIESFGVTEVGFPVNQNGARGELTMQDHVAALAEYTKRDGFAKGRVIKQLMSVGLLEAKPAKPRRKRRK